MSNSTPAPSTPTAPPGPGPGPGPAAAPAWALRVLTTAGAALALAAVGWLVLQLLLLVPLVTVVVAVALLLTALAGPLAGRLRRVGVPAALSALTAVLLLLGVLTGIGGLVGFRVVSRLRDLTGPLAAGIDRVRTWLTDGPLELDPEQVAGLRDQVVTALYRATPGPVAGARMVLFGLSALGLVVFLVFFLLKDGAAMWGWLLERVPRRRRDTVDDAGRAAWVTLVGYVRGVVLVALIDAVGIGAALVVLDVPLWVSLTLLTFLGAFVPIIGATVTGAVAVLVTLVTNGVADALVVLVVVLVVQQLEGNVLQPLITGRAVHLHPVVILLSVTAGTLVSGLWGAVVAVPVVAVLYRVAEVLRARSSAPGGDAPAALTEPRRGTGRARAERTRPPGA